MLTPDHPCQSNIGGERLLDQWRRRAFLGVRRFHRVLRQALLAFNSFDFDGGDADELTQAETQDFSGVEHLADFFGATASALRQRLGGKWSVGHCMYSFSPFDAWVRQRWS